MCTIRYFQQIAGIAREPNEEFCRLLLQSAGVTHVRARGLDEYRELVRTAFREFINQQILQRLDIPNKDTAAVVAAPQPASEAVPANVKPEERIATTEAELEVFRWVQQRLAFLVDNDNPSREISNVSYRDYQGKFAVFYKMDGKDDFSEGFRPA